MPVRVSAVTSAVYATSVGMEDHRLFCVWMSLDRFFLHGWQWCIAAVQCARRCSVLDCAVLCVVLWDSHCSFFFVTMFRGMFHSHSLFLQEFFLLHSVCCIWDALQRLCLMGYGELMECPLMQWRKQASYLPPFQVCQFALYYCPNCVPVLGFRQCHVPVFPGDDETRCFVDFQPVTPSDGPMSKHGWLLGQQEMSSAWTVSVTVFNSVTILFQDFFLCSTRPLLQNWVNYVARFFRYDSMGHAQKGFPRGNWAWHGIEQAWKRWAKIYRCISHTMTKRIKIL